MEKRTYPRHQVRLPVKLEASDPTTNLSVTSSGEIIDISMGGAKISLSTPLSTGTSVKLDAELHSSKQFLPKEAQVRWAKPSPFGGSFLHGLQFLEPDIDILKKAIQEINIHNIESFFNIPLPCHLKQNFQDTWISKKNDRNEIMEIIDFEPPFLKIEKIITFDTNKNGSPNQDKSLATGIITTKDTKGHYNDTIFLALCGWLMASSASVHLAVLSPKTVPQVVEANGVRPLLSLNNGKNIWKPAIDGTRFFVETTILKQKLKLAIVTTSITFSNILFGVIDELKIITDSRESIFNAITFPEWQWNNIELK